MESGPLTAELRETLALFEDPGVPRTTPEVATRLDLGRRTVYARLERLVERERLETKKVGANARVWWRPPASERPAAPDWSATAESLVHDVLDDVEVGIFVLDDQFDVAWINETTERYFGLDRERVLGRDKRRLVDERIASTVEDDAAFVETVLATYDDNSDTERFECHVTPGEDRTERWLEHRSEPIEAGEYAGGRVELYYDVTARKRSERDRRETHRKYERRLEAEKAFTESVLDNQRDIVYAFDTEGTLLRWNDRFREVTGYTSAALETMAPADFVAGEAAEGTAATVERVIEHGESATAELPLVTADGEEIPYEFTAGPITDGDGSVVGVTGVGRDVSDRKERERRLERQRDELRAELDEIYDRVDDAFFALDEDLRFVHVNEQAQAALDRSAGELLGEFIWDTMEPGPEAVAAFEEALESQDSISFEEYYEPLGTWFETHVYPSESGLSVYFRDISERKRRERELEESRRRYRTLVENFPNGTVALVDEDLRYVTVGGTPLGESTAAPGDLEGSALESVLPPDVAAVLVPRYEAALDGEAATFEAAFGGRTYRFRVLPVRDDDGEVFAAMGMSQDVTEQIESQRRLRDAKSQLEAATEAGAIGTWEWHVAEDRIVVGASFARQFGVDPDAAREGVSIDRFISAVHEDDRRQVRDQIETALASCGEYEAEFRIQSADGDRRWVVARGRVECDDEGAPVRFPGALTDITDRKRAELELEKRRGQLAALNNLNEVVQDVTNAVVDQSTREEIETTVCERLASAESYRFAWICEVDPKTGSVVPRAEAGVEGYLDAVPLSVDPDDPTGQGPAGEAIRTGEMQVAHAFEDDAFAPWREYARRYDYRSSAAIPIVHEGTLYGVLGVYTDRARAFDGEARAVVSQLGEIVGHAIAAAEQKQALMSDELVELEFLSRDALSALDVPDETNGAVTLDHAVPLEDDEFLVYGSAAREDVEAVRTLVDAIPYWESVTVRSESDPARLELRLSEPPVLSVVASLGGYVDSAAIEDGDYRLTVHLAPSADVRRIIEAVEAAYPGAELLRRRQIDRARDDAQRLQRRLVADLTDRQQTALAAAYHAGHFEWPRAATGEAVAGSLGVAPPTFHQHLRKAERKVFDALFSAPGSGLSVEDDSRRS
jgi:PAS domain S-box-containing protein